MVLLCHIYNNLINFIKVQLFLYNLLEYRYIYQAHQVRQLELRIKWNYFVFQNRAPSVDSLRLDSMSSSGGGVVLGNFCQIQQQNFDRYHPKRTLIDL